MKILRFLDDHSEEEPGLVLAPSTKVFFVGSPRFDGMQRLLVSLAGTELIYYADLEGISQMLGYQVTRADLGEGKRLVAFESTTREPSSNLCGVCRGTCQSNARPDCPCPECAERSASKVGFHGQVPEDPEDAVLPAPEVTLEEALENALDVLAYELRNYPGLMVILTGVELPSVTGGDPLNRVTVSGQLSISETGKLKK